MRSRRSWIAGVVLTALGFSPLLASPALSPSWQSAAAVAPAPRQADAAQSLVTEFDARGLKVILKRRGGSQTVAAGLFLRGGARNLTPDTAGVEALMLEASTEATVSFPRDRMRRELATTGTSIGSGVTLDYSVLSLASTRQNFDRAWAMFTDVVLKPTFAADDVDRVRTRMLASLSESESSPESLLDRMQSKVAYAGHPYQNDPRGSMTTVARLTLDDIKRSHTQMLQTSRLLLVVVGDLDPKLLQQKVEAAMATVPRGTYQSANPPALSFSNPTVQVTARDLPTNFVNGVYAAPSMMSADYYPLRVATSILEQRVFEEVRVKRSLSYSPDAFLEDQSANVGGLSFSSVDPNRTVLLMLNEIARLQTVDTQPDEIRAIAQQFLTSQYLREEASAAQAGVLAQSELIGGGWRKRAEMLQRIREVTPAEVRRVANTYMHNIQFVAVGDPKVIDTKAFTQQR